MKKLFVFYLILSSFLSTAQNTHIYSLTNLPSIGSSPTLTGPILNIDTFRYGRIFNVKDYGAKGDSVHNDGPAIQATINAASVAGGGTVFFPSGIYIDSDTLLPFVGGKICNCQLYIPLNDSSRNANAVSINFIGEFMPSFELAIGTPNWVVPRKGAILESTIVGTGYHPAMIGTAGYSYHGEFFNPASVYMDKMILRTNNLGVDGITDTIGTMGAVNFERLAEFSFGSLRIDVTSGNLYNSVQPATSAIGLIMPAVDNSAVSNGVWFIGGGYDTLLLAGEHTNIDKLFLIGNVVGIKTGQTTYDLNFGRVLTQGCQIGMDVTAGDIYMHIGQWTSEHLDTSWLAKWFNFRMDIHSGNLTWLHGSTNYLIGDVSSGFAGINNGKFVTQNVRNDLFSMAPSGGALAPLYVLDDIKTNAGFTIAKGVGGVWEIGTNFRTGTGGVDTAITGDAHYKIRFTSGFQFYSQVTPSTGAAISPTLLMNIDQSTGFMQTLAGIQLGTGAGTVWGQNNLVTTGSAGGALNLKSGAGLNKICISGGSIQAALATSSVFQLNFGASSSTTGGTTTFVYDGTTGNVSIGKSSVATALSEIGAGNTTTAPMKFTQPTSLLSVLQAHALELKDDSMYYTGHSAAARNRFAFATYDNGYTSIQSYASNFGSSLTLRSVTDKGYVDSANALRWLKTDSFAVTSLATRGYLGKVRDSLGALIGGGSSPPFADNTAIVKNNSDPTKLVKIDASRITTGNTRTLYARDSSTTIAGLDVENDFFKRVSFQAFGYRENSSGNSNTTISVFNGIQELFGTLTANRTFTITPPTGGSSAYVYYINVNTPIGSSFHWSPTNTITDLLGNTISTFDDATSYTILYDGSYRIISKTSSNSNGTYTPTVGNTTNVASSSVGTCYYSRNGNQIHVWGRVTVAATLTASATSFDLTLPIASVFTTSDDASGQYSNNTALMLSGGIVADAVNAKVTISYTSINTSSEYLPFSFDYVIK